MSRSVGKQWIYASIIVVVLVIQFMNNFFMDQRPLVPLIPILWTLSFFNFDFQNPLPTKFITGVNNWSIKDNNFKRINVGDKSECGELTRSEAGGGNDKVIFLWNTPWVTREIYSFQNKMAINIAWSWSLNDIPSCFTFCLCDVTNKLTMSG